MMTRKAFVGIAAGALISRGNAAEAGGATLDPERFRPYVEEFNRTFREEVVNYIPDAKTWDWMKANIPFFACPDREMEQLYYYRWWEYRKHIKDTPAGFLITEFLKPVKHAGEYNALSCAFGLHVAEGRWLRDPRFVDGDIHFWLRTGENGIRKNFHQFSQWTGAALYGRYLADARRDLPVSYLDALVQDYEEWERERLTESGLFWQRDVSDGMESSISGGRKVKNIRPSINSYLYGSANAISLIASMAGDRAVADRYREKAGQLRKLVQERLWNPKAAFFETRLESGEFAPVRELIGYTPWYVDLPTGGSEYELAWEQLIDPNGFYAPYGPTTAERRNRGFEIAYEGDDCQWNGPSWPFATTITLNALANAFNHYRNVPLRRDDYFRTFEIYTRSQHLKLDDGRVVPFIDENLNPFTGQWLARARKMSKTGFYGRGDHYNHSGYADLVITGIAGLRPRGDDIVEVNPLLPSGKWEWFCLDAVPYHGRSLTVIWDRSGTKFGKGKGLAVFANGKEIARSTDLTRVTGRLA